MLDLIISGGQTGADQSGWRAARAVGLPTGGWMPLDFMTEDGPRPEFEAEFGAKEWPELCLTLAEQYRQRTKANILWAHATFIFDTSGSKSLEGMSRGTQLATRILMAYDKPSVIISTRLAEPPSPKRPEAFSTWLAEREVRILNIAGNRESKTPGIGAWVEAYMTELFRLLKGA